MTLSLVQLLEKYKGSYIFYEPLCKELQVCYLGFYQTDPYGDADIGNFDTLTEELKRTDLNRLRNLTAILCSEWREKLHIQLSISESEEGCIDLILKGSDSSYTRSEELKRISVNQKFFQQVKPN